MAPSKTAATSTSGSSPRKRRSRPLQRVSEAPMLHPVLRYVLAVQISLVSSSILFSLASEITGGDLALVSKRLDAWGEVAALISWKAVELGVAWVLGYDGRDMASLTLLTHFPTFSLLSSFYGLRPTTIITSFVIVLVSLALPFAVLRDANPVHRLATAPEGLIPNRAIIQDIPTTISITLLGSSVYAVFLYLSYATWLPAQLVTHFENLPDVGVMHSGAAGLPTLLLSLLPAGYAARDFLFVSSAAKSPSPSAEPTSEPPEAGTERHGEFLIVELYRRFWVSRSEKMKTLVSRTVVLASMIMLNTLVQLVGTVRGVDVQGAAAWSGIWAAATLAVGTIFAWIEAVDGV